MKLVKLLILVIAGLVITSVTFANHSLDDSQKVADLTGEILQLEKENSVVNAEIAASGSLTAIAARIEELGYIPTVDVATLGVPGNVASR